MVEALNKIVLTLLEATLTLYPANSDGTPNTSSPLWTGVPVENVEIHERWEGVETRASGAKYPKRHPLVQRYEVDVGRVWALPLNQLDGFTPGRNNRYVLDLTWTDEEGASWHRRTFYGVTLTERGLASREIDTGETERQVFDAENMAVASGTGSVATLSESILQQYIVRYVDKTGASTDIYLYDRSSHGFTELVSNPGATMAAVGYAPDQTGVFQVTFAGAEWSALRLRTDGAMEAMQFITGAPKKDDLPRVEFWYGPGKTSQRWLSVTSSGKVYAHGFREQSIIPNDDPSYLLYSASTLNAALEPDMVLAKKFEQFTPASVSGLKGWWAIEDLRRHAIPLRGTALTIDNWPNRASGGPALVPDNDVYYLPNGDDFFVPPLEAAGKAAVLLDKDASASLYTASNFVQGFDHCAFVVCKPGQRDGISGHGDMSLIGTMTPLSGEAADGSWLMALENFKCEGYVWTSDGTVLNTVTGTTGVATQLMRDESWLLLEGEMLSTGAGSLTLRRNGVQEATHALTGTLTDADIPKPISIGGLFEIPLGGGGFSFQRGTLDGLLRAVVLYEGQLTNENKARVRNYLNLAYDIY